MKSVSLFAAILIAFTMPLAAQVAQPQTAAPIERVVLDETLVPRLMMPAAVPPTTISVFYADTSQPLLWRVPTTYQSTGGNFQSQNLSQRFTLPTSDGFLDSIYVYIAELPLGQMRFDVLEDVKRAATQTDTTQYHYPDYWRLPRSIMDTAVLKSTEIRQNGLTKVVFNHKVVPQEFHILASPMTAGGVTSLYGIVSDSRKATGTKAHPVDSRTVMLIIFNSQAIPIHMWGLFQNQQAQALAPNLWLAAFVEVDGVTGKETIAIPSGPMLFQNSPNPVTTTTEFTFALSEAGRATLDVFDLNGRRVASVADDSFAPGIHRRSFDASTLPAGTYVYRLAYPGGQFSKRLTVVR